MFENLHSFLFMHSSQHIIETCIDEPMMQDALFDHKETPAKIYRKQKKKQVKSIFVFFCGDLLRTDQCSFNIIHFNIAYSF